MLLEKPAQWCMVTKGYSVWTDEGYGFVGLYPMKNEAKAAAEEVLSLPKQLELSRQSDMATLTRSDLIDLSGVPASGSMSDWLQKERFRFRGGQAMVGLSGPGALLDSHGQNWFQDSHSLAANFNALMETPKKRCD